MAEPFSIYQTDTASLLLTFRRVSLWSQRREQTRIVSFLLQLHQLMMMTGKQERKDDLTSSAFCSSAVQRPRKAEGSITWEIHITTVDRTNKIKKKKKKRYLFSLCSIRQTFIKYYSYALYLNRSMLNHIRKIWVHLLFQLVSVTPLEDINLRSNERNGINNSFVEWMMNKTGTNLIKISRNRCFLIWDFG